MPNPILFEIRCQACGARMAVTRSEVIGQIVACLKCGAMILVENPAAAEVIRDSAAPPTNEKSPQRPLSSDDGLPELTATDLLIGPNLPNTLTPPPAAQLPEKLDSPPTEPATPLEYRPVEPPTPSDKWSDFGPERPFWLQPVFLVSLALAAFVLLVAALTLLLLAKQNAQPTRIPLPTPAESVKEAETPAADAPVEEAKTPQTDAPVEEAETPAADESVEEAKTPQAVESVKEAKTPEAETPQTDAQTEETPKEAPPKESMPETPEADAPQAVEPPPSDDDLPESLPTLPEENIDIPRRLELLVRSIKFPAGQLPEMAAALADLTGVPISLDLKSIDSPAQTLSRTVAFSMENVTAGEILRRMAEMFSLEVQLSPERILLTPSEDEKNSLQKQSFDVSDLIAEADHRAEPPTDSTILLPKQLNADVLTRLLTALLGLAPDEAASAVRFEGTTLTVEAPKRTISETIRILERLRQIRRLPSQTDLPPSELIPEALGWERLEQPMSLRFLDPVTLREALTVFGAMTKTRIFVDTAALRTVGASLDGRLSFAAAEQRAEQTLTELLASSGLTWMIAAEDLAVVTSKEEARQFLTVGVLLYADPEAEPNGQDAQNCLDEMSERFLMKNRADDETAESEDLGAIFADPTSGCLLTRLTQPAERSLRHRLENRLKNAEAETDRRNESKESP